MADLSDIQAAETVKIVGSDSVGLEGTPVLSTGNGELNVSDVSLNGGLHNAIVVGTTAVEAKVGALPMSNRKEVTVLLTSGGKLYYGYSNTVTSSTGTPIFKSALTSFAVGPNTHIWLISDSAGQDVRITES